MMTRNQKRIVSILLIIILLIIIGAAVYLLFLRDTDSSLHVRRLGGEELTDHKVSQFSKSSLDIYPYGAFEIQLIRKIGKDEPTIVFVGIGTYTKTKAEYIFTYVDCYYVIGTELEQRESFIGEPNAKHYKIEKNGRLRFDFQGILYYFGR